MQSGYDGPREASWAVQSKHAEWIIHTELCVYLIPCQILRVFQANRKGGGVGRGRKGTGELKWAHLGRLYGCH